MRPIQLILLLSILLLFGCQMDINKTTKEINHENPCRIIIDTSLKKLLLFPFNVDNPTWMSTANYNFFYIGEVRETFFLYSNSFYSPPLPGLTIGEKQSGKTAILEPQNPFSKYYIDLTRDSNYKHATIAKIDILFDTTTKLLKSFPAFLINVEPDTITIGLGNQIPIIMEAMDSLGNWKPIQENYVYMCGNGLKTVLLPPKECAVTFVPIFEGDYKTKLRLAIGNNYSKSFSGFINYRQFESVYDENYDLKEEYKLEMRNKSDNFPF